MKKYILILILSLVCIYSTTRSVEASVLTTTAVTPNTNIPAGTLVSFQIYDPDASQPAYTLSDSFPGSTLSNSNITLNGQFSWTPTSQDIGTHTITITTLDTNGIKSTYTQVLTVSIPSAVTIQYLSPGPTVSLDNTPVSFAVIAQGYTNPYYSVSDSFSGTSIQSYNINTSGNFSWLPKLTDVGVHNLSIDVHTPNGRSTTVYQTITVNGIHIDNLSSNTVVVGSPLTFSITPIGLSSPSYQLSDSARNNTLDTRTLTGNNLSWTPQAQDIGTHTINITATDINNVIAKTQLTIVVTPSNITTPVVIPQSIPSSPIPIVEPTVTHPSTLSPTFIFTKALSLNSKGTEVTELQKRLTTDKFYSGPITGKFESQTKAAVIRFQKAHKLTPLGSVGPGTRAALNKK